MDDPERGIHELWTEPWEGLPEEDEAWTWEEDSREQSGRTTNPPHDRGKWFRWYFVYHKPTCNRIKISADQDPETGHWFNPHPSSGTIWITMIQKISQATPDQQALGERIEEFYGYLNTKQWSKCFELIDPKLRDSGKVEINAYSSSLSSFFAKHGPMANQSLVHLRVYTDASNKNDDRDFAYGEVTLEDREHHALKIRERWVKDSDGRWYSRMAGMV